MTDRRVLIFGDSFVAGVGDPEGRGWTGRVASACFAAGLPLRHYALGIGGQTSTQVAVRWQAEARPRLMPGADCRVAFSFGTNDTTQLGGDRRVAFEHSLANLAAVLEQAGELGLRPFVVGPPPACEPAHDERVAGLDAAFAAICAERAVPYVTTLAPLLADAAWTGEAAAGDGVHPGAGGYATLTRLVLDGGWLDWLAGELAIGELP